VRLTIIGLETGLDTISRLVFGAVAKASLPALHKLEIGRKTGQKRPTDRVVFFAL